MHKLGYGTSATVWIVQDRASGKYLSLKILTAEALQGLENGSQKELKVLLHLRDQFDEKEDGNQYVVQLLDHFEHRGPNGLHLCIVTEALGPSLASDIDELYDDETIPPGIVKCFVYQAALGVRYPYKIGVVHGVADLPIRSLYAS